jgi:23S rRNA (cytosine1962-C5)-methyltransferase
MVSIMSRPRVELKVDGFSGRVIWFRKMVRRSEVEPGSLVDIFDKKGIPLGPGFYNPRSELAVRLLRSGEVANSLQAAIDFREKTLQLPDTTNCYRLCHAEGDGLSGLIVDRYDTVDVVEIHALGMYKLLDQLRPVLRKVHVRANAEVQRLEGFRLPPQEVPDNVIVEENGVQYHVDFKGGHKTGFFCDQRDNRLFLRGLVGGKSVLDLCTYTGGFALNAVKGGATEVAAVDLDEVVLETARKNAKLNRANIEFRHADLFNYLKQMKQSFDVIVLDPPKLAPNREEIFRAKKKYFDMNLLAIKALPPGGILVSFSCSGLVSEEEFLGMISGAGKNARREMRLFRVAGAGADHPVSNRYPEGRYLKAAFHQVL